MRTFGYELFARCAKKARGAQDVRNCGTRRTFADAGDRARQSVRARLRGGASVNRTSRRRS
jgi:hypothetical protein